MNLLLRSTEHGTSAMGYIKGCAPPLPACPSLHKNLQHAINYSGEALGRCFGRWYIKLSQGQNDYWAKETLLWNLFKNTSKLEMLKINIFLLKKTNQRTNPQIQEHKTPKHPQKTSQAPNLCHWTPARGRVYVPLDRCQFSLGTWPTEKDERMKFHTPN